MKIDFWEFKYFDPDQGIRDFSNRWRWEFWTYRKLKRLFACFCETFLVSTYV
jgi:hypothetical protein